MRDLFWSIEYHYDVLGQYDASNLLELFEKDAPIRSRKHPWLGKKKWKEETGKLLGESTLFGEQSKSLIRLCEAFWLASHQTVLSLFFPFL